MEEEKDKDKDEECALRIEIFKKYWDILKRNYKDTQHNEIDFNYYFSIFREYKEKDFINAVKLVLKYRPYFPRIDEIVKYLPVLEKESDLPEWFYQNPKRNIADQESIDEMNKLLKDWN